MIINKTNVLYTQVKLNEKRKERIKLTRRRSEVQIPNWTKEGVKCEKWLWLVASSKNIVFRRVEKLNVTIETHLKSVQNEDPIRSFNLFQCKFHYAGCIRYMYLIAIMIFCRWADSPSWKCTHIHTHTTYVWYGCCYCHWWLYRTHIWKEYVVYGAKVNELKIHGICHNCVFFVLKSVFFIVYYWRTFIICYGWICGYFGGYDGIICSLFRMEFLCEHLPVCSSFGFMYKHWKFKFFDVIHNNLSPKMFVVQWFNLIDHNNFQTQTIYWYISDNVHNNPQYENARMKSEKKKYKN